MSSMLVEAIALNPDSLRSRSLEPVRVAILDSGIDSSLPTIRARVTEAFQIDASEGLQPVSTLAAGLDHDNDDHGTAVADIVARVAPNAQLIDLQIVGDGPDEMGRSFLAGLSHAILRGYEVINCSLTCSNEFRETASRLCDEAHASGQIVVAAKHNNETPDNAIPAALAGCIGVDSMEVESIDTLRFHERRPIELSARGIDISVATPGGGHRIRSGSSFAAPHVSGLCALLLGAFPRLTPFEVRSVLKAWAERPSSESL